MNNFEGEKGSFIRNLLLAAPKYGNDEGYVDSLIRNGGGERFAIGGGISGQPLLMKYIKKNLDEIYSEFPYMVRRAEVVACRYLNASNLPGVLVCFLREEKSAPRKA